MEKKQKKQDWETELKDCYRRWEYLREHGGSDPFYADGTNMNLVRNHILYYKSQMMQEYGAAYEKYPDIFYQDTPPEVNNSYMARTGEIRDKAAEALELCLSDRNFKYLLAHETMLDKKEKTGIYFESVTGYVSGLAKAVMEGDLVVIRRHAYGMERYQEALAVCAGKVQELIKKKKEKTGEYRQLSLSQYGMETGRSR